MTAGYETAIARAPGRVELLGNHTDYNEGVVLGAAIDRVVKITGAARGDDMIHIRSSGFGAVQIALSELGPLKENRWANHALGVVSELIQLDVPVAGFSADLTGDLPIGCGLSSSAAFELATALFLLKLFPHSLTRLEIARVCQRAEHCYVGVQSGLLDQVTSLFGRAAHVVFFDCRTQEIRIVPFPPGLALIIADSGKQRELAQGEYNVRREQTHAAARALGLCALRDATVGDIAHSRLPDLLRRRAMHVVGENERVWRAVAMLERGDEAGFGELMNESHESSRRNFENSTPDLDALVSIAQSVPGVLGARLTGAGFGGAIAALCDRDRALEVADEVWKRAATAGITPHVLVCQIADGAC